MTLHRCDACDICRARTKRAVDAFCDEMRAKLDAVKAAIADPSWRPAGIPNPYAQTMPTYDDPYLDFRIPPVLLGDPRDTARATTESLMASFRILGKDDDRR